MAAQNIGWRGGLSGGAHWLGDELQRLKPVKSELVLSQRLNRCAAQEIGGLLNADVLALGVFHIYAIVFPTFRKFDEKCIGQHHRTKWTTLSR